MRFREGSGSVTRPVLLHFLFPRRRMSPRETHGRRGCSRPKFELGVGRLLWRLWACCCDAESRQWKDVGFWQLRQHLYWMQWPTTQLLCRLLAHHDFHVTGGVEELLRSFFHRLGDTKLIEDSNKKARAVEQHAGGNRACKTLNVFHEIRLPKQNTLASREVPHVEIPTTAWALPPPPCDLWSTLTNPTKTPLPVEWRVEDVLKPAKTYTSKSPAGRRVSIGAAKTMVLLWREGRVEDAQLTEQSVALTTQTLVQRATDKEPYLVLASTLHGAWVWHAEALAPGEFGVRFSAPWTWLTITDVKASFGKSKC